MHGRTNFVGAWHWKLLQHFHHPWRSGTGVMGLLQWTFDIVLGFTLMWLAWQALASENLFKGIVLFIAFGLLMALAWVRLDAPDIALAEAAIGAGLTGALLLAALAKLEGGEDPEVKPDDSPQHDSKPHD